MNISLQKFIKHGKISEIKCGSTLSEVMHKFGRPNDISLGKFPKIYDYGGLRITIYQSEVIAINIIIKHYISSPNCTDADGYIFSNMTYFSACHWLDEQSLLYEYQSNLSYDDQKVLKISASGVGMYFEGDLLVGVGLICV